MNTTRGGPQRMSPANRREQIIQAARPELAKRGLHNCTIRQIAAVADVAVGTITYHFGGMADLLAASLQAEMTSYSAGVMDVARAEVGANACRVLIDGLIADGADAQQHWSLWCDFWALAVHEPEFAQWQKRVYITLHQLCSDALGSQDEAVEFIALMDGLVVQTYVPDSRLQPAAARAILHSWLERREQRPAD